MPLFLVQDDDRPLWIIAPGWAAAVRRWREQVIIDSDPDDWADEDPEPDGVQRICDDDDMIERDALIKPRL